MGKRRICIKKIKRKEKESKEESKKNIPAQ